MAKFRGEVIVISGPSGAGKTSIARRIVAKLPQVAFSVSATTRSPRPDEVDGVDYFFCTPSRFDRMIEEGALLEWATYAGHRYGTPQAAVLRQIEQGVDVILDIEVQGAAIVKAKMPSAVRIFVLPPAFAELQARIDRRGGTEPGDVAVRLRQARCELARARDYDYVVVNDQLDEAVAKVAAIMAAERCRVTRQVGLLG